MVGLELVLQNEIFVAEAYPRGWYAIAFSDEVKPSEVKVARFLEREYVLWRTASGELSVMEPYCPHLGAHLGHGGEVFGEAIRCPMHHFRFGADGQCVSAGYGCHSTRPNQARTLECIERAGLILARHGAAGDAVECDTPRGATQVQVSVAGTLQDVLRRLVGLRAFGPANWIAPPEADGTRWYAKSRMDCAGLFGGPLDEHADVSIELHGPGFGLVQIEVAGAVTRIVVGVTPVNASEVAIHARLVTHADGEGPATLFPRQLAKRLIASLGDARVAPRCEELDRWYAQFAAAVPAPIETRSSACG